MQTARNLNLQLDELNLLNLRVLITDKTFLEAIFQKSNVNLDENRRFSPPKYPKSEQDRLQLLRALEGQFMTQNLNNQAMQNIIDSCCEMTFSAGQNIITQGEQGNSYYILKQGKCQVVIKAPGKEFKSKEISTGEGFGEIALLYNEKRSATVRALSETKVWALDGEIFKKIIVHAVL